MGMETKAQQGASSTLQITKYNNNYKYFMVKIGWTRKGDD